MITAADFVEVKCAADYPVLGGAEFRARYFRDGKKYGVTFTSDCPEYEIHKVAQEVGTIVQCANLRTDSDRGWHTVTPIAPIKAVGVFDAGT